MKKIQVLLLFTLGTLLSNAQINTSPLVEFQLSYITEIPEISSEHEVLNRDLFFGVTSRNDADSIRKAFTAYLKQPYERRGPTPLFSKKNDYTEYDATNGILVRSYEGFNLNRVIGKDIVTPYVYINRVFYSNDSLERKFYSTTFGFKIGKEYHYDTTGTLTKIIDHDEGYGFTAEDILNYCIKRGIDLNQRRYSGRNTVINKRGNDKKYWEVRYSLPYYCSSPKQYYRAERKIDGQTGTLIKRSWIRVSCSR